MEPDPPSTLPQFCPPHFLNLLKTFCRGDCPQISLYPIVNVTDEEVIEHLKTQLS